MKKLHAAGLSQPAESNDIALEDKECAIGSLAARVRQAIGILRVSSITTRIKTLLEDMVTHQTVRV